MEDKVFIVIWHYKANYDVLEITASSAKEACEKVRYYDSHEVEFYAFPKDSCHFREGAGAYGKKKTEKEPA